jgi:hypothetical protein
MGRSCVDVFRSAGLRATQTVERLDCAGWSSVGPHGSSSAQRAAHPDPRGVLAARLRPLSARQLHSPPLRLPRVARPRRRHERGRGRLARLPALARRPRPRQRLLGHFGRPSRLRRGDRGHLARVLWQCCRHALHVPTCSPASPTARSRSSLRWCARSSPSPTPTSSASSTGGSWPSSRAASPKPP